MNTQNEFDGTVTHPDLQARWKEGRAENGHPEIEMRWFDTQFKIAQGGSQQPVNDEVFDLDSARRMVEACEWDVDKTLETLQPIRTRRRSVIETWLKRLFRVR